jgi:hypothetical protein
MLRALLLGITLLALPQATKKYPWQHGDTHCNETMTFCWYGPEEFSDGQVTAYGQRWVAQDNAEKPFEWITEVRCVKEFNICILARNQKVFNRTVTNIDLYRIQEWSQFQIRAIGESDFPHGKECEIDTLLLNRAEPSVSMLSVPGPAASTKACTGIMKPKTVIYKLEIGPPKF